MAEIRQAEPGDSGLVALLVSRLLDELSDGGSAVDDAEIQRTTAALLGSGTITAWLAMDADQPVGLITVNECAAIYAGGRFGEITELYIDPDRRSSGLGQALIDTVVAAARARGWPRLEVGAPDLPRWRRTVDFYQRCGFVTVGPRLKLLVADP